MTPEQHLAMVAVIRSAIGKADGPSLADGERMIRNHELMARVRGLSSPAAAAAK